MKRLGWRTALMLSLGAASWFSAATSSTARAAEPSTPRNVTVTPGDGRDYQQPSLAVDPANPRHVALAYQDGGRHELCGLALSEDGGASWSARALIGAGSASPVPEGFAACWNPSVEYGRGGVLYYLFQTSLLPSNPYSHVLLAVSHDGGRTFDPAHVVDPASPEYPGMRAGGNWWPQMAVDRQRAVLYVTWSRFTPELDSSWILVAASRDGGRTFAAPLRLSGTEEKDVTGSQAAVEPDGTLFVDWFDYTQSERGLVDCVSLWYSPCGDWGVSSYGLDTQQMETYLLDFYRDEGSRLDFTQGLGCENYVSPSLQMPAPLNYYVHVERGGSCDHPGVVRVATSSDGGASAHELNAPGTPVDIGCSPRFAGQQPPAPPNHACSPTHYSVYDHNVVGAAAGTSPGEVLAAWWDSEGDQAQAPSRLSISLSVDGGQHWRTRTAVGATGYSEDRQHRPVLSVAPNGRLDVVYYDLTPSGAQNVYAVSASNPRRDLSSPLRISSRSSSTAIGPQSDDNRASFGDHLAVVSTDQALLAAWTGTQGQHQDIAFAGVPVAPTTEAATRRGPPIVAITVAVLASLATLAGVGVLWLRGARNRHAGIVAAAGAGAREVRGTHGSGPGPAGDAAP